MRNLMTQCCEVERTIAKIYRLLATMEGLPPEIRGVFGELALDEEDHAVQIECALEIPDDRFSPCVEIPEANNLALDLLQRAKAILADVREHPKSQADAVGVAMDLEQDFRRMHLFAVAHFPEERLKTMFSRFARYEEAHLRLLEPFLADGPQ
ncbi:hypothetical protein [Geoalkalibacter sp.]|uniref:hypothetical protein n=1 Tax=Geoalkalibacter sp. TaxID=3041440 RepID=UPI00272EBB8E|nr:hypothetical protein [Geoalkalibacter sp.]